ncbi:MAG TPA: 5'-3' exonuclease H3TH domain-containing protein [Actinomycetota bacterium]|nr:5'-3' exonuclease H3TH domain-containing protein [Actinomycetota bacterium]
MARRLLLDTSSLMYRAYYALPDSIADGRGRPVNAVHGYLDMTSRLVRERRPNEVIHCYDADWRPAERVEAYDGYKAQRLDAEPDALGPQFQMLEQVLTAAGQAQAWAEGWEAEDAIGSLCAQAPKRDRHEIVTGDRDLVQLVRDPQVRLLFTRRGVSDLDELDEARVREKYGIPASRYADFAVLRGDPSDGLPGVAGVGEKTARALVLAYPSLDDLAADAAGERRTRAILKRSPALRARIAAATSYIDAMREVVPIRTDLRIELVRPERDDAKLDPLARRLRLSGPVRRLREALAEAKIA